MSLSPLEIPHYEEVGIDPAHVKDILGIGAQSMVRRLEVPDAPLQVVKSPLHQVRPACDPYGLTIGRILSQTYDAARRQFDQCSAYLQEYMVPTEFRRQRDGVRAQLSELFGRNGEMLEDTGHWLDAMGFHPAKLARLLLQDRPYLENVTLVGEADDVRVFDSGLFPMPSKASWGLRWYFRMLHAAQRANAAAYGFEFAPPRRS